MGKSTILEKVQAATGARLVEATQFLAELTNRHPLAVEEAFLDAVRRALSLADTVLEEDLHLVTNVVGGCGNYPRANLFDLPPITLLKESADAGKKLVFANSSAVPEAESRARGRRRQR
jgi:hypothetical protein